MTVLYAVAGRPVFGSKEPVVFNTAFRQLAMDAAYIRLAASSANEIMATARQAGIAGFTVTDPFQAEIAGLLDKVDAAAAGCVDTVVNGPDGFTGYNLGTPANGVAGTDGREMLLARAISAFSLFTGAPAPVDAMRKVLMKTRRDSRRNIALIGIEAAGKKEIGRCLAEASGLTFVDIDSQIEGKAGVPIAEVFETKGEAAFRRMEQEEIDGLRLVTHQVAVCGAGALGTRSNVRTLRNNCLSIWLWADMGRVVESEPNDAGGRLLDTLDMETARGFLMGRLPGYALCSDLVVSTEGRGAEETAAKVWEEVHAVFDEEAADAVQ